MMGVIALKRFLTIPMILSAIVITANLLSVNGEFLFSEDYQIWDEHGLAVGIGGDFVGLGYSYMDSGYLETETGKGFLKLKLKVKWEKFLGSVVVGNGWNVFLSYEVRKFVPFPSKSFFAVSLGSDGMYRMWDNTSKMTLFGIKTSSRSVGFSGKGEMGFSMNTLGYMGLSLGYSSSDGGKIAGIYIPVGSWDEGFLIGGWWEDGLVLGVCGREAFDVEDLDLELMWSVSFKEKSMKYFLGLGTEMGKSKLILLLSDKGWGLMVYE